MHTKIRVHHFLTQTQNKTKIKKQKHGQILSHTMQFALLAIHQVYLHISIKIFPLVSESKRFTMCSKNKNNKEKYCKLLLRFYVILFVVTLV
jgi:hypothetical protein